MPTAVRRLWRDRPRLIAVLLLALAGLAASGLQSTSALVLAATLDENWRGEYDILVTQAGHDPAETGLLHSDALVDAATGRLSVADLDLIRALPGVDVAAPVSLVSFAADDLIGAPALWLPVPVSADGVIGAPEAFRICVTGTVEDPTGQRQIEARDVLAFAYLPTYLDVVRGEGTMGEPRDIPLADAPTLTPAEGSLHFVSGVRDPATGTITLGIPVAPRPAATVALVDPVAERALLGDGADFLDPLIDYAGDAASGIVVIDHAPPDMALHVTVEQFAEVTAGVPGSERYLQEISSAQGFSSVDNGNVPPRLVEGAATTLVDEYDVDVSALLDPFGDAMVRLGDLTAEQIAFYEPTSIAWAPRSVSGPSYLLPPDIASSGIGARIEPKGYASFGAYTQAPVSADAPAGSVTDYSKLFGTVGRGPRGETLPPRFEVVGEITPAELGAVLDSPAAAPLGAYDVPVPSLTSGGERGAPAPSITGFGIPGTNPIAIGSLSMLDGLDVERPISAIRIRVAGIDDYTPAAQRRLLNAVGALQALGFTATIVAGSSPQPLDVVVGGYAYAQTAEGGGQSIGDLGTIEQTWSRLGAVREADTAVSATGLALLSVSVLAVAMTFVVVQFAGISARRQTAGVLRGLGWRRSRIRRWFLAEDAVAVGLLLIAGAVAVALASVGWVTAAAVGTVVAVALVTLALCSTLAARPPRPRAERAERTAAAGLTFARMARRQITSALGSRVVLAAAASVLVVAVTAAIVAVTQGSELAGTTELAAVALTRGLAPHAALLAIAMASAIVLAVQSERMRPAEIREQGERLRAMGWPRAFVVRLRIAEIAAGIVPGLVVGAAIAVAVAAQVH